MNTVSEDLTRKFTLMGFGLTIVVGAIAAGVLGYGYYYVANVIGFDFIILLAVFVGGAIGWVVGQAARLGRLRQSAIVLLIGLLFGVIGYGARYLFEFNELIEIVVEESALPGEKVDETRAAVLAAWKQDFPPGGYIGYLKFVAETGFSLKDVNSSNETEGSLTQGTSVWILLALEGFLAGIASAGIAHAVAIGPLFQSQQPYSPRYGPK